MSVAVRQCGRWRTHGFPRSACIFSQVAMHCFSEQMSAAIAAGLKSYAEAENLSRTLWKGYAARLLTDDEAQAGAEAIEAQKRALAARTPPAPRNRLSGLLRRIEQRSSDKAKSRARRRCVAMCGAVPAKLASYFTEGERAALSVVAGECRRNGSCQLPLDAIASMAGICRRLAQVAIRAAEALGLLEIRERPRRGAKHLPHVMRIISPLWRQWLKLGEHRVKKNARHENHYLNSKCTETDSRLRSCSVRGIVADSRTSVAQGRVHVRNTGAFDSGSS